MERHQKEGPEWSRQTRLLPSPALGGDGSRTSLGIRVCGRYAPRTVKKERCPPASHIQSLQTEELLVLGAPWTWFLRHTHWQERRALSPVGTALPVHRRTAEDSPPALRPTGQNTSERDLVFMVENHVVLCDELQ